MFELILCIGMINGYCSEVKYEFYPTLQECQDNKVLREKYATDFLMASCRESKK